jgi:enoyl-CoA hydratase/carnithine racemase
VLATLGESLGWSFGAVWRTSAESATLRCTSVWHAPGARGPVRAFAAETPTLSFAPGQGLPGRVWAFRRTAWVADVARERNMPRGHEALRAGLVSRVWPAEEFQAHAAATVQALAGGPTTALALTKRLLREHQTATLAAALDAEAEAQASAGRTADHLEGVAAFMAKRPAVFSGR